jgi:acylphosphatase
MSGQIIRKEIKFTGDVQGVGFRYRAKYAAGGCAVTGWVRNEIFSP